MPQNLLHFYHNNRTYGVNSFLFTAVATAVDKNGIDLILADAIVKIRTEVRASFP